MVIENIFTVYSGGKAFFAFISIPVGGGISRRKRGEGGNPQESLSEAFKNAGMEVRDVALKTEKDGQALFTGKIDGQEVAYFGSISSREV